MSQSNTPPGWYPDHNDQQLQRYWDGVQWTPYTQPAPAIAESGQAPGSALSDRWKALRLRTKVLVIVGAIILLGLLFPNEEEAPARTSTSDSSSEAQADEPEQDEELEPEPEMASVPKLVDRSLPKARSRLRRADLKASVVRKHSWKPAGTVLSQRATPGSELTPGTAVILVVAKPMPRVPGTAGSTGKEALAKLRRAGFRVKVVRQVVTSGTTGMVLSQKPIGTTRAAPGSVVEVTLAKVVQPAPAPAPAPAPSNCTPGYSPCLPPASDYDCAGGSGDGPKYTGFVRVTGSDPYGLDADGDGAACES